MSTERTFALTCWAGPHPAPQALSSPKPLAQHTTHKPHVTTHPCQSAHTRLSGASAAAARRSCSSHNTRCSAAPRGHTSHTVHNTPCAKLVLLPSRAAGIAASSRPPHLAAYDLQSLKVVHSSTKDSAPFASMRGSSSATSCASAFNAEANPPRMSSSTMSWVQKAHMARGGADISSRIVAAGAPGCAAATELWSVSAVSMLSLSQRGSGSSYGKP
jgi:hypothetical protein